MWPKTLRKLSLAAELEPGTLTVAICEQLEALQDLDCCLHQFDSTSCLSVFNGLIRLNIRVWFWHLASEEALFSELSNSSKQQIKEIGLFIGSGWGSLWELWLTQLQDCPSLTSLTCSLGVNCGIANSLPIFLKCLPPSLTELHVHPIPISSHITTAEERL